MLPSGEYVGVEQPVVEDEGEQQGQEPVLAKETANHSILFYNTLHAFELVAGFWGFGVLRIIRCLEFH